MNAPMKSMTPTSGKFVNRVNERSGIVTQEILKAYMEKHPYISQAKPEEYAYMTDDEWLETDKWADMASKMMILNTRNK